MIEKVQAQIIAEVDDPSLKKAGQKMKIFARDTWKELDKSTYIRMQVDIAKAQQQLAQAKKQLKQAQKEWNKALELEMTIKTNMLQSKLTEAKRQFNNYANTWEQSLSRLQKKFDQVTDKMWTKWFSWALASLDKLKAGWLALWWAVTLVIWKIWQFLWESAKVYNSQQSAFAWVKKTLDATAEEFDRIDKELKKISTTIPKSYEELARIAEVWWQMGISADNIWHFTDTVAKLSMAIAWVDAEEAATQMARIMWLAGESVSEIDRMGSSLVELWNNYKATEWEILNFANNIAWTWAVVWMTSADILWISTAFVDVWVQAEAWWSAVMKALLSINDAVVTWSDKLAYFASVAWMSAEEFSQAWREDSAWAFTEFVKWLWKAWDDANRILWDLLWTDIRLQRAFLAMAQNAWVLENAIQDSNDAWRDNIALMEEVEKRMQTNEAKLKVNQNKWEIWKANIWSYISEVWLWWSDFTTKYIPKWVEYVLRWLSNIWNAWKLFVTALIWILVWLKARVDWVIAAIQDKWEWLTSSTDIMGRNIQKVFQNIPSVVLSMANSVIAHIEWMINKAINLLNQFIEMANNVPWIDVWTIWPVSIWRIWDWDTFWDWMEKNFESLNKVTTRTELASKAIENNRKTFADRMSQLANEFEKSDNKIKAISDLKSIEKQAIKKTEEQLKDDIIEEQEELDDLIKWLQGWSGGWWWGGGWSKNKEKDEIEEQIKALKQKSLEEIKAINESALAEEDKLEKIKKIKEQYDKDVKKLKNDEFENEIDNLNDLEQIVKEKEEKYLEYRKKSLKDKAKAEIDAINASTKSEKQKVDEINKIYEQLDEDLANLEKNDEERAKYDFKKRQELIKEMWDSIEDYYEILEDEQKEVEKNLKDINDEIEKTQKNIEKIQTSIEDLWKDTSDKLASREAKIEEKLNEMKQKYDGIERLMDISENVLKQNLESTFGWDLTWKTILEYKQLYEELELIKKNSDLIMEESRNKAVENETERILRERAEKLAQYEEELALEQAKLEELEIQKEQEEAIYQEIDDYRRALEEEYHEFLKEKIDQRISRLERLRQQALATAAAVWAATWSTFNVTNNMWPISVSGSTQEQATEFVELATEWLTLAEKWIYK